MNANDPIIHTDPEIMGGTPVFFGTRVPATTLFNYLSAGKSLATFLDHFPTVEKNQVLAALRLAQEGLLSHARAA